jgi:hypothetical protein
MSRFSVSVFSALTFLSLIFAFAPSAALAAGVNCDVNACISACQKRGPQFAAGQACTQNCLQVMDKRKKSGQCK